ncbi:cell wall metabolism sensor histidine kinase WalK [Blastococcus sp. TF02A-30]|uniref:sensor histidine kinase n=1 Tax=Blastococcus sp. TF02A-30 TaxID=2250580 RepID=UPI000DEBAD64|nr:ATP-binding protein [Blastococcus sp. TF02A-30]RBY89321.1 PAS domain-containing sensor histidine kinase [Blastococcus sp. TF02A-30]
MTTAVLDRGTARPRLQAGLTEAWRSAVLGPLPCSVMFGTAALLMATGTLPVTDVELVLAGLATALAAITTAWLSPSAGHVRAVAVPLANLGAVGLVYAGTDSPAALFLLVSPLYGLVSHPRRAGVATAVLGTLTVLLVPELLGAGSSSWATEPASLVLGPLVVGLGGAAVHESGRRLTAQAAAIQRLQDEQAALLEQVQSRADELDQASRILAARAQTMTSVIDAVTEQSIIGTDPDGTIRVWNPGAEKLLGLLRADVVRQRSIVEFHLPEELEEVAAAHGAAVGLDALVHAAQEHGSDVRDWTYVGADGRTRTVSVAVTPRTDDRGVHAGWNFVGTDMTEVRATERMKDQFVSLISHELRTPLTSILGYLELVLDDEDRTLTDEQRQYLSTVERNADRLLRLVGDLLFTARVEAGQFTLQPEDVDLVGIVRAAEETARVAAATAGVELVVEVPDDAVVVSGDAVRLGQACDNLVSNAVKFTPAGGRVTLTVEADRQDGRPVARMSVRDTGIGIPNDEQGKLFTRFFRASTATRNAVPGVGLGLTITKAITTAHGGSLDLASVEGEGTTFTLTLPREA